MKKVSMKKWIISFLTIAVLCASVLVAGLASDANMVSAETVPESKASGTGEVETTTPYVAESNQEEEDKEDSSNEAVELIEGSADDGMYYNANGGISDFRDETIYFVITTRFYDGDSSNNVHCWDGKAINGSDTPWRGDFKGLIDKLDYIKALGFTAVWITPVVKNASGYDYHGYHAINFKEVDKRYESADVTYQDLIDAVHERGMKIIQDVVFNHTGNWGEENLYPIFKRDMTKDQADTEDCMIPNTSMAGLEDYNDITASGNQSKGTRQFLRRLQVLNVDGDGTYKYDAKDIYHHTGFTASAFEQYVVQTTSIHYADCIDLNTENPTVYKYLVDAYSQYIRMGVDAFRVDTVKHISRLTFNKAFITQLNDVYNEVHGTTGEGNFYMFGEVCARYRNVWNDGKPAISSPFYTWKETKEYAWDDSETEAAIATNTASVAKHWDDNLDPSKQPTSKNVYLDGNNYHTPDYSQHSGLNVIDFPMHWAFKSAGEAYQQALAEDPYYNDSSFNVTYVDSHDYAPDGAPENQRFAGSSETWAENLSLMFTFRGIPCLYYGSEIEFKKGCKIDEGPNIALENSGRAYFGDHIEGSVDVADFARYSNATGAMAETLNYPLSLHIQRLNRLRAAIPALRKGQYSTEGCKGNMAFKRRYTDSTTDSFALIALTSDASFTGIPNGKYTDAITGDVKTVSDGKLSTSGINGQGDLRVYVLDTDLTKAPGIIEGKSDYMSGDGGPVNVVVVKPTGITLDGATTANLDLGETAQFKATVSPSNATSKTVSWSSSDTTVATVSSSGVVTAKGEGTATIYAATSNAVKSDYDNKTALVATATVTVKATGVRVTSLTLSKKSVSLEAGEAVTIKTTIMPPNASAKYAKVTWASADTKVAKVSDSGVISAVKQGKTTVTATTMDGVSATVDVEVKGTVIYGNAVYFEKPSSWGDKINVYMWKDDETYKNASWPGVAMAVIDEEKGVYGIEWPEGVSGVKVIFNSGSDQTKDLEGKMNGYYTVDGYKNEVETKIEPETSSSEEQTETESQSETETQTETEKPTVKPTETQTETEKPTVKPTETQTETEKPTVKPTETEKPTVKPTETEKPTVKPTETEKPTVKPTETEKPTVKPTETEKPTVKPTETEKPTVKPTETEKPTVKPTETQTETEKPTVKPTETEEPTEKPTTPVSKKISVSSFTSNVASGRLERGSTVKLKATAKNATGTVKYRFSVKFKGVTYIIRNYTTKNTVNWKPQEAGKYTLIVNVKDNKGTAKKVISNFTVNTRLKVSNFQTNVDSSEGYIGKTIKLSAKGSGGSKKYQYKFAYVLNGKLTTISDFSSSRSVNWVPKKAGTYRLIAYVKDAKSETVVNKKITNYVVRKDNSLVIDEFEVNRKSGAKLGKTLKFTYSSLGGDGKVQYRITAKYNGSETIMQNYSSKTTFKYRPKAVGTYKFTVTAKDSSGSTAEDSIYFVIK